MIYYIMYENGTRLKSQAFTLKLKRRAKIDSMTFGFN
jgi:hypothetical protein